MASHVTKCLPLAKGRRIRVTRLDGCGRPIFGDDSQVVSKGFISVSYTANTTETDEINIPNASGEVCIYEPSVTSLVGYGIEIAFCNVDPELLSILTGQEVVLGYDGNTVIGFDVDTKVSLDSSNFALELWAGSPTGDACNTAGSEGSFGYILLPFVSGGILGDFTVENAAVTFTVTGANTKEGNAWGVGPYDVMLNNAATPVPSKMSTPVSTSAALRTILVDLAPPQDACGARPLLDPALPALTSVTATEDTDDSTGMTADFVVAPVSTGPVWYDFGDGTWDYVDAPGASNHEYENPGTYTVRASQNGTWVSTTVTVPFP
jgi:hypothetical protein